LDDAKTKLDRNTGLFKGGVHFAGRHGHGWIPRTSCALALSGCPEEIRNRQALLVQRRSELAIADSNWLTPRLSLRLTASSGKRASVGEYLLQARRSLSLFRVDPLRLRAEVPERDAASIRNGQQVRVTVEGNTNVYQPVR